MRKLSADVLVSRATCAADSLASASCKCGFKNAKGSGVSLEAI
jgi:hypothetical protein